MGKFNEEYLKKWFATAKSWISSKRFSVYLYCVAIATFIWFLMKFSGSFSTQLPIEVNYNTPSSEWYVVNNDAALMVDVKGFGFSIMWHRVSGISEIDIDLSDFEIRGSEKDPFIIIPTDFLFSQISKLFSDDESIDGIYPNILKVDLSHAITKKVPIVSRLKVYPENGYKLITQPSLYPDKIELSGPAYVLSEINKINTNIDTLRNISESQVFTIALDMDSLEEWVVGSKDAELNIEVDELTSGSIEVKVNSRSDEQHTIIKILPTRVSVFYQVGLKDYELVNEDLFKAFVVFPKDGELPDKLKVNISEIPDFVEVTRIDPPYVEYLLSKSQ